ncbi:NAD-dependent epimerase/dehydratase family protein [Elizabethkingia anophelis]|uniref:NAD-dependent epimerase/dehydratase family protein n=1 Tax=Elizabethkingia anophelis TaxID=1117645 RepID=UPI000C6D9BB7|nr:NAD-dependent epimerase/dehydratase family protein [Elizabethkingia anophelis]MCT3834342.1 NAD-dependent epimerase/dehydratase family protein [Elizabethkingia anophelis]MCT3898517.1 NAD-dependent epimerase/dehydratase family protein [Elizabethkingia anophelis]MCT3977678.1 NAD-dependent epimerase/dehydratase family protein [Elizabethkingia anophelis]MCT4041293.1 NAD-dependent epimerase/dehydratase family protein [Elizabethkingia anophelis]MCT4174699.1 NAD-dependent epimerase/dehydratase fami
MKIAVIGGSGFVGTRLIDILVSTGQYNLLNIDKNVSEKFPDISVVGNVMDKDTLISQLQGVDIVVLLAAEHRDDVTPVSLYYDVNVEGMRNTLEAMEANNVKRIIFTSSVAIYGLDKNNPDESFPADPFNHYGKSKWEAEQVLQKWYKEHEDWNINIIRPTVIFGEGNRGNVYNLLNQIANGKFMMIGKGNNQKSMSYIRNVIAFIKFLIEEKKAGYNIYNYVDKPDFTTNDLVHHTSEILNKNIPTTHIPYWIGMLGGYGFDILAWLSRKKLNISSVRVKKFCAVTQYDSTKAMTSGFKPPYTMEEGLKNMLNQEFGK